MEEQQLNHQSDSAIGNPSAELVPHPNPSTNKSSSSSTGNILDAVSAIGAVGGAVASIISQQAFVAAIPLALSVGVHLVNRRQSIDALQQHIENLTG